MLAADAGGAALLGAGAAVLLAAVIGTVGYWIERRRNR